MTVARWDLPKDWQWVEAGEVADIVGGGTPSTKESGNFAEAGAGVPWIGPADLTRYENAYIEGGRRDLTEKGLAGSGATLMPAGTVLFSSRAPIGYCAIAANPITTNQGFKSWICGAGLLPEYVRHYLLASVDYIDSLASGTTFREVSGKRVASIAFPLPPEAEQRRIVAKLDALTARLTRARAELDRVPVLAESLRQAALDEAFNRPIEQKVTLSELGKWSSGGTPKSSEAAYYGGDIPWLRSGDLPDGPIGAHFVTITDEGLQASSAKWIPAGAILIAMYGATIGKLGITTYPVTTNQAVACIVPAENVDALWLFYLLLQKRPQLIALGQGGAQPNISQQILKGVAASRPPPGLQRTLATELEAAFARAERLEAEAARARALLDRLEAAILARAFRGELVPQDPNDEPASALLVRMRARREAAPKAKRGRRAGNRQSGLGA